MVDADAERPRSIGRYVVFREIARGGMATVHVGRLRGPAGFARTVAIERLHQQFARDPEFVAMFLDEARLAARIQHPNVVSVLDVVAADGELFLVMDYVHGESLYRLLQLAAESGAPVPKRVFVTIIVGVLNGLEAAHEARSDQGEPLEVVHRDVSPQNVLLGLEGQSRVLDFGVAKAALRIHWSSKDGGELKGKLGYMAPEQVTTASIVDRRADIYAAGVMLWEGLTGQPLHDPKGKDIGAMLGSVLTKEVQPPSKLVPGVPPALDEMVIKALQRNPEDRFARASDMSAALERAVAPATARQVGEWVAQVAGATLGRRAVEIGEIERAELPAGDADGFRVPTRTGLAASASPAPDVKGADGGASPADEEDRTLERRDEPTLQRKPGVVAAAPPVKATGSRALVDDADDEMLTIERRSPGASGSGAPPVSAPGAVSAPRSVGRRRWLFASVAVAGLITIVLAARRGDRRAGEARAEPPIAAHAAPEPGSSPGASLAAPSSPSSPSSPSAETELDQAPFPESLPSTGETTKHAATPHPWTRRTGRPKPDCNPPYTLDSDGVKIPKRACF